jgi:hypothetical protein
MSYDRFAVRLMSMSDKIWIRHANPWSAWTRIATAPFWFLAIWSWVWIGWWAFVPAVVLAVWTWLNPRVFGPYVDDKPWSTRGVLGERIFMNRKNIPIPREHLVAAHTLSGLAGLALMGAIVGFATATFWLALGGWLLAITFKIWFVDRMVWLYETMSESIPEYQSWKTGPGHRGSAHNSMKAVSQQGAAPDGNSATLHCRR